MNFAFDEDQRSLGDTVAAALRAIPALTAPDLSTDGNASAVQTLSELGLFSLLVPEQFGGVGLQLVDVALAVEALGAELAPSIVAATLVATEVLRRDGSIALQQEWLPRIASGEARIGLAVSEVGADYGLETLTTTSESGKLNGRKILVAGADLADAYLVLGTYAGEPACWLVDATSPGLAREPELSLDPTAALSAITFADVAAERLNSGAASRVVNVGAIVTSGLLIGIGARMLAASVDYASSREQFGQPIGAFQAIKHRCADMAVGIEAARSAAYYAFWAAGEDGESAPRAASMAKAYCGDVVRFVCNESIQIHGGMGFTWELGLHRFLRRSKLLEHQFGDAVFHRERVVETTLQARNAVAQQRDAA